MRVALVSANPGKLRELRALLPRWELDPLDTAGIPEETGATFAENARAKARWGRERAPAGAWTLGEDSGLEVDGLGGAPGVRSARYAGEGASDERNLERLLGELEGVRGRGRRARYVCELALVAPDGVELSARGTLEGSIAREPRGSGGFGYDPAFVPAGETETVGVLGDAWKARSSHRARAARALREAVWGVVACPPMEAARALADLIEISTQIECAVLVDEGGTVVASTVADPARAGAMAGAARELLGSAERAMGGEDAREPLVQLQAATPEGCVFVVQDGGRVVAAVTVAEPTSGLVFYDLKTCLRHVAGEELAPKPKARAGSRKAAEPEANGSEAADGEA